MDYKVYKKIVKESIANNELFNALFDYEEAQNEDLKLYLAGEGESTRALEAALALQAAEERLLEEAAKIGIIEEKVKEEG